MIVYNGDTLIAITLQQATRINLKKVEADKYRTLSDSLSALVANMEVLVFNCDEIEKLLKQQVSNNNIMLTNYDSIGKLLKSQLDTRDAEIKKQNRQIVWLKIKQGVLLASTAVIGVLYLLK